MPEIVSKADAIAQGLKHYCTGKPCKHGHLSERYTSGGWCVECGRLAGKSKKHQKQARDWSKKNPEKVRAYSRKYYHCHPEKAQEYRSREEVRKRMRSYRLKNRARWNKRVRERARKIGNLLAVLKKEMPELLKEFGL